VWAQHNSEPDRTIGWMSWTTHKPELGFKRG
jgi:hypothetical protein